MSLDKIVKAVSEKHNVKISLIDASKAIAEISMLQNTNSFSTVILSRVILNTALIGSDMKKLSNKITAIVNGAGPIGTVIGEYENKKLRGFCANPNFDLNLIEGNKNVLTQTVGVNGYLQIIKDLGLKKPFVGKIDLVSGEINMDFTFYLVQSEQIKSLIVSSVKLDDKNKVIKAVGVMVQLLPNFKDEDIDYIEEQIGNLATLSEKIIDVSDLESILVMIDCDAKILDEYAIDYACTCSEEKAFTTLKLLEQKEIEKVKEKNSEIEVKCDFCKHNYVFKRENFDKILKN